MLPQALLLKTANDYHPGKSLQPKIAQYDVTMSQRQQKQTKELDP